MCEPELFTCNVCGFLRFASAFSYDDPTSDVDGGGNYCEECEEKAIKCPKCKYLGFWISEENIFVGEDLWDRFTIISLVENVFTIKCHCGEVFKADKEKLGLCGE